MAKFSDLPQELRDIIWKFAIRPEGPTAHYFSVHARFKDDYLVGPQWSIRASIHSPSHDFELWHCYQLAAPRCGRDGSFSWVVGNYSTYMEDSALWTTCRDSRHEMIRRFRPYETNRRSSRESFSKAFPEDPPGYHFEAATVTAVLQRDNGERQRFTIQPQKDLIILQTLSDSFISLDADKKDQDFWRINDLWEWISRNTLLAWSWEDGVECRPRHIAIKLDPKWPEQGYDYELMFLGDYETQIETLWFVDERLQLYPEDMRSERGAGINKDKKVFNAMGRRFLEVDEADVVTTDEDDPVITRVFSFVGGLQWQQDRKEDSLSDRGSFGRRCNFNILACELL